MAFEETNFSVCGLCSQLVDESMVLKSLRSYLSQFLAVNECTLPSKVCIDCYQSALESSRFHDRCKRSIEKIRSKGLSSNMILGMSTSSVDSIMPKNDSAALKNIKTEEIGSTVIRVANRSSRVDPVLKDINVADSPINRYRRRSTRVSLESNNLRSNKKKLVSTNIRNALKTQNNVKNAKIPNVIISVEDRNFADRASNANNPKHNRRSISKLSKKVASHLSKRVNTPTGGVRRALLYKTIIKPDTDQKQKIHVTQKRKSLPSSVTNLNKEKLTTPSRKRTRGSVSTDEDIKKTRVSTFSQPQRQSVRDFSLKKEDNESLTKKEKENKTTKIKSKSTDFYYVDTSGATIEVDEDRGREGSTNNTDEEEIFPSIGPYQCEICHSITSTKREFVAHIKRFHRDVVDEDVLRSLENDIQKAKPNNVVPKKSVGKVDRSKPVKKKLTCDLCKKNLPADISLLQHQKSRLCLRARTKPVYTVDDPHRPYRRIKHKAARIGELRRPYHSTTKSLVTNGVEQDEVDSETTCTVCGKSVSCKDLANHMITKSCQAKKYEKETEGQSSADQIQTSESDSSLVNQQVPSEPTVDAPLFTLDLSVNGVDGVAMSEMSSQSHNVSTMELQKVDTLHQQMEILHGTVPSNARISSVGALIDQPI